MTAATAPSRAHFVHGSTAGVQDMLSAAWRASETPAPTAAVANG